MVFNEKLYTLQVRKEIQNAYNDLMAKLPEEQRQIIEAYNEISFDLYGAGEPMITPTGKQVRELNKAGIISDLAREEYNIEMMKEKELEEMWERKHPHCF